MSSDAAAAMAGAAGPRTEACQVLLVEDEPANRALVRAIIGRARPSAFVVREARTLSEARDALAKATPDVVLLDVRLPDGSGLDLIAELRPPARPGIIVLSASVLPAERLQVEAAGIDGFLAKPYAAADLLRLLNRWCTSSRKPTV